MDKPGIKVKKKLIFGLTLFEAIMMLLLGRIFYIQAFEADYYQKRAFEQQTRDRLIAPRRGDILDRNGNSLATTQSAAAISVIHAQVEDEEEVARQLSEILELDYEDVLEDVKENVALKRIKSKVDNETAAEIRELNLPGVMIDEDVERTYPYYTLAASVIGFVGKDNQGIIGLESKYEEYLK